LKKKVLIFGYGSIGEKHATILSKIKKISEILIYTNRKNIKFKTSRNIKEIVNYNPDYIIVCSETYKHYNHIKFIEKNFKNKTVLVEKPLFHKKINFNFKNNKYYVGYNLRFHPVIEFIRKKIKKNKIFSISLTCNSFLPKWRKNINYNNSYSSFKNKGGGVLLDLSHEIDYLQWLFGDIKTINYKKIKKISNLKITSEDMCLVVGKIKKINFFLNLTYFSRNLERRIIIDAEKKSIVGDLINNNVQIFNDKKTETFRFKNKKNQTYIDQHLSVLNKNFKKLCNIKQAKNTLSLIDKLKKNS